MTMNLTTIQAEALKLDKEGQIALLHELAKANGLKIQDPSKASAPKKWETAQKFYEVALVKRTDDLVASVKAKKITWEAGARKLMGTQEFKVETTDFSPKGKERLQGELNRMVRKFAKDTGVDYDKVLKVWDTPEPKAEVKA